MSFKSCNTCLCSIPSNHNFISSSLLQPNNCLQAFKFSFTAWIFSLASVTLSDNALNIYLKTVLYQNINFEHKFDNGYNLLLGFLD